MRLIPVRDTFILVVKTTTLSVAPLGPTEGLPRRADARARRPGAVVVVARADAVTFASLSRRPARLTRPTQGRRGFGPPYALLARTFYVNEIIS